MKKAVIATGGKQYLVTEGETLEIERLKNADKTASFDALLVLDGDKVSIGTPLVDKVQVLVDVVSEAKADKVTSIRYKAKKRVHTVRGHRQILTKIKVTKIA